MANKNSKGLGRGIDALFSNFEDIEKIDEKTEKVQEISLDEIRPNPYQPRKTFDDSTLRELADSIMLNGVIQPVILRQSSVKGYEIIAGERRVRASRLAGKTTIPAIVREFDETAMIEVAILENLQREGFQPFFACQTRVRDPGRRGYTKHMLRLRRAGEINGEHVFEIILLNSHDGTSSYQMLPGYFRFVCQNGCVCGQSLGEVRVPHRGNVVEKVIEGAYEVVGVFDRIEEKRDAMQSLVLPPPARQALAQAALTYRYGDEHQPVTTADILTPRRREDYGKDLWSTYQTIQENMLKGGISGRSAKGKRIHTRAIHSIDTDIKLNRALWVMTETLLENMR